MRERLLEASIELIARDGFHAVTPAAITEEAGLPAEAFAEHFDSVEDCFIDAIDAGAHAIEPLIAEAALEAMTDLPTVIRALTARYLQARAKTPALTRAWSLELAASGPRGLKRTLASDEWLADLIHLAHTHFEPDDERSPEHYLALIGGANALFNRYSLTRREAELPEAEDAIVAFLVDGLTPRPKPDGDA